MPRKKLVRFIFISLPLIVILIQILIPYPAQQPAVKTAARAFILPLEMVFRYFDFNQKTALEQWEQKIFSGHVMYWIDFEKETARLPAGQGFLHSKSQGTASAIFQRLKFDVAKYPHLSWNWAVKKFPNKTYAEDNKKRDDFAARMYVVFVSGFFANFRCVEYVWDESFPEGTILESPYSSRIKQMIIQSGPSQPGEWVSESRNVLKDYQKLFGETPKMKAAAIAVMTDSEGTQDEAEAFFDDIKIGKNYEK
jgi:hypothetical protein